MDRVVKPARSLEGEIKVPGDKSVTHRAYILGSLCPAEVQIENVSPARDCFSTLSCLKSLGIEAGFENSDVQIKGRGLFGLNTPDEELNAGNSGSTARLLCGVLAGQKFEASITGDDSLKKRPMKRVIYPLIQMGAVSDFRQEGLLPVRIQGRELKGMEYLIPLPSAQVKSALLLAGLLSNGTTVLTGRIDSRDHTERILSYLGASFEKGKDRLLIEGKNELTARKIVVPGDISSAAFFIVAAVLLPNSLLAIRKVGLNPSRTAALAVLKRMGADITLQEAESINNEQIGTIIAKSSELRGTEISASEIPGLIDEIPILAVAATQAEGITLIRGASELRVKESDRLSALATELRKMGAKIRELPDGLEITGPTKSKGSMVNSWRDHRIAMALAVAGLAAEGETCIEESEWVDVSFPNFFQSLESVVIR